MACRTLQVVGNRPVVFVAEGILDHVGNNGGRATQLCVTEVVAGTLFSEEAAVRVVRAFGNDDGAVAVLLDLCVDRGEEFLLVEFNFGEEHHDRDVVVFDQSACGSDPACVATHHLENKNLGRGFRHRTNIVRGFKSGDRDVLGDRTEAGTVVGDREIIVDGFRNMDRLHGEAHFF